MKLRTEGLTLPKSDDERVILDLASSLSLSANGSGAFLAVPLTEERTEQEFVATFANEYDLTNEADAVVFLRQLTEKELLISS